MDENLFFMQVAKCKRCGGILLSDSSKKRGYGASCYKKRVLEIKNKERNVEKKRGCEPYIRQTTIFDYLK